MALNMYEYVIPRTITSLNNATSINITVIRYHSIEQFTHKSITERPKDRVSDSNVDCRKTLWVQAVGLHED